jgi:hypothetical protein
MGLTANPTTQNPPPPGEGNRVAVEGALFINARERVAAFAAFSVWALSVGFAATSPGGRGFSL